MNKSSLPAPARPVVFRGERLRELREAQGWDIPSLAKRLALSPAQLRQLESNQGSLFYSDAIRLATARKVSAFLGESLVCEPAPVSPEDPAQEPGTEAQAQVSMDSIPAAQSPPVVPNDPPSPARVATPHVVAHRVLPGESRIALSGWSASLWGVVMIFVVLLGLQAFTAPEAAFSDSLASDASTGALAKETSASAGVGLTGVSLVSAEPQAETATASVPELLPVSELSVQVSAAPSPLAPTSVNADQAGQACVESSGPIASFTPTDASKDPAQIFVQGAPGQVVCVKDGRGQVWRHEFSNAAGRRFSGSAPWLVESGQLMELQIYFQGNRVRPPLAGATRLRLIAAEPA